MAVVPELGKLIGPADEVYTSFEETPVDELPKGHKDGDDQKVKDGPLKTAPPPPTKQKDMKAVRGGLRRIVVPHPRDLRLGKRGKDVLALQRALAAAKVRKWGGFTSLFGLGTKRAVKAFQKKHGLKVDGVYGLATHRKMAQFYDAHGIKLIHEYIASVTRDQPRARLLAAAHIAYNYGTRIHYTQGGYRMMMVTNHIHHEQIPQHSYLYADCSGFATWLYWDAGVPDPNHLGYNGQGFTGTLSAHGTPIHFSQATVGCLYFYGYSPYHHVTINVGKDRCISQGTEYGPNLLNPLYPGVHTCHKYPGFP